MLKVHGEIWTERRAHLIEAILDLISVVNAFISLSYGHLSGCACKFISLVVTHTLQLKVCSHRTIFELIAPTERYKVN
jgi:hypothetical protein